jgi:hypothetical protein
VIYVFAGTLDLTRLLEVLGGGEKSKLVPMVFYSMRETSQEQERVMGEATSVDVKRLEEIEGQVAASDNGTLKTEANQLKEKILISQQPNFGKQ